MQDKLFVDTSGFYAIWFPKDDFHKKAIAISNKLKKTKVSVFTSNYIIDESLTLLSSKVSRELAIEFGKSIFEGGEMEILSVDLEVEKKAWEIFAGSSDRRLSFTDCTSFVIMKENGMKFAFSFDKHFEEFGFRLV